MEGVDEVGQGAHVVPVLVRRHEVFEAAGALADQSSEPRRVVGSVDEELLAGGATGEEVGVVRHLRHRDLADDEVLEFASVSGAAGRDVAGVVAHRHNPAVRSGRASLRTPDGSWRANQRSMPPREPTTSASPPPMLQTSPSSLRIVTEGTAGAPSWRLSFVVDEEDLEVAFEVVETESEVEIDVVVDDLAQSHECEHPALEGGSTGSPFQDDVPVLIRQTGQVGAEGLRGLLDLRDDDLGRSADAGVDVEVSLLR